jgi:hypothetical protein
VEERLRVACGQADGEHETGGEQWAQGARAGGSPAQQPENQRQPDDRLQDGKLEQGVGCQIAAKAKGDRRQQRCAAVAGDVKGEQIGEKAGEPDVQDRLELQDIE